MSHAELCPVCAGRGVIKEYPSEESTQTNPNTKVCHGCGGKGWVTVLDANDGCSQPCIPYYPGEWCRDNIWYLCNQ